MFRIFVIFFRSWKIVLPIFLLTFLFLYFRAGFNTPSADTPAVADPPPTPTVAVVRYTLACTSQCMAWGQCGQALNRNNTLVLLAHSAAPALTEHDLLFDNGVTVRLAGFQEYWVTETTVYPADLSRTEERRRMMFYRVVQITEENVDFGPLGWLPEWCVHSR